MILEWLDIAALVFFVLSWIIYGGLADRPGIDTLSVTRSTHRYRSEWMQLMVTRQPRVMDVSLVGNLMRGVSFFASTTIFLIGGLVAMLGAAARAIEATSTIPLFAPVTVAQWQLKILVLVIIFIYAFFKFIWSMRQFNYCSIVMGATPESWDDEALTQEYVNRAARLNCLAGDHFNRGLRAYSFGLAALAWFVNAWLFMLVTLWVVLVLYRREFGSETLKALKRDGES